ncbi:putative transcription factor STY-LRP1 family [Helianthus anomalus]
MWSSTQSARQINYGIPEMGMLGLRDVFVVADHLHSANVNAATPLGMGVGVIPLLTATPLEENMLSTRGGGGRGGNTNTNTSSIQFWQQQQPQAHNYLSKPMIDHGFLQAGGGSTSTSGSTMTCQDCGNQAKKDCSHRRCRTCCKSRGFDCATHVKSTWVPAARRRERQLMTPTSVSSASTSGPKKPRLTSHTTTTSHTSTSNTTPPRSFDTSSSHHKQDASFKESLPGQVRAPAVFKCVRVTAVEDGDDEYAYQASATIGGHVFKGFLYDQGVETRDSFPNFSELHLGATGSGRNVGGSSSSPLLDTADVFGSSAGGGLLTGSAYGNPIN